MSLIELIEPTQSISQEQRMAIAKISLHCTLN